MIYSLPHEHNAFLAYIFDNNKIKVLNNIIGIMYVDQEKGWSLLNRGTVIGRIKFNMIDTTNTTATTFAENTD